MVGQPGSLSARSLLLTRVLPAVPSHSTSMRSRAVSDLQIMSDGCLLRGGRSGMQNSGRSGGGNACLAFGVAASLAGHFRSQVRKMVGRPLTMAVGAKHIWANMQFTCCPRARPRDFTSTVCHSTWDFICAAAAARTPVLRHSVGDTGNVHRLLILGPDKYGNVITAV
jgi:hypothetical protein